MYQNLAKNVIVEKLFERKNKQKKFQAFNVKKDKPADFENIQRKCPQEIEEMLDILYENFFNLLKKIEIVTGVFELDQDEIEIIRKYVILSFIFDLYKDGYIKTLSSNMFLKSDTIEGETDEAYFWRTIKVILESDYLEEIPSHKDVTHEAIYWANVFIPYTISFLSNERTGEDFILNDRGFSVERDKIFKESLPLKDWVKPGEYESGYETFKLELLTYSFEKNDLLNQHSFNISSEENEKNLLGTFEKSFEKIAIIMRCSSSMYNFFYFPISTKRAFLFVNPFFTSYNTMVEKSDDINIKYWPSYLRKELIVPDYDNIDPKTYENARTILKNKQDKMFTKVYKYKMNRIKRHEVMYLNMLSTGSAYEYVFYNNVNRIFRSLAFTNFVLEEDRPYDSLIKNLEKQGLDYEVSEACNLYANKILTPSDLSFEEKQEIANVNEFLLMVEKRMKEEKQIEELEDDVATELES